MFALRAAPFFRCFLCRGCWLIVPRVAHAVEVAFKSIDVSGPEAAELRQPSIHLPKRFWLQVVETALCVHCGLDEAGVAQHAQMLGNGGLRHTKLSLDLAYRLLGRAQEAQDRATIWFRDDFKNGFHAVYIPRRAYTCQGIYEGNLVSPDGRRRILTRGDAEGRRRFNRRVVELYFDNFMSLFRESTFPRRSGPLNPNRIAGRQRWL
jgi:hypothetical protein